MFRSSLSVNDLAIIKDDELPKINGSYVIIKKIKEIGGRAFCSYDILNLEGNSTICGMKELQYFEKPKIVPAPWRAAYAVYVQNILKKQNSDIDRKKSRAKVKLIADKYAIDAKTLHKMLKDLNDLEAIVY